MGELVEPDFINPVENRPKLTRMEDDGIPIIDLSCITSLDHVPTTNSVITDPKMHALIAEIREACEKWGFFKVVNHGVPVEIIGNLMQAAQKFFGQTKEEKEKVKRCVKNPMGYHDDEHSGDVRDWKEGFDYAVNESALALVLPPHDPQPIQLRNRRPAYPPEWRDVIEEYGMEVTKLSIKLIEIIFQSLELSSKRLTDYYKDPALFMRLNHYTPCPHPDLILGIGAHKDAAAINLLYEDGVGGLQIKRKSDGEWITLKPIPGAFVVNVGETLQVWSNDKYESVEHRVMLNPERERFSITLSVGPSYYVNVKPLDDLVDENNPPKYREFNYGAFRASIMRGYAMKPNIWELEISNMKIN